MSRLIDIVLTLIFVILFGYYLLFVCVIGGVFSEDNQLSNILLISFGLILILFSLTIRTGRIHLLTRISGILMQTILIYFDIDRVYFETKWDFLIATFKHIPTLVLMIYLIYSLTRVIFNPKDSRTENKSDLTTLKKL